MARRTGACTRFREGTDLVALLAAEVRDGVRRRPTSPRQRDALCPAEVVLLPPVYPVAMRDFLTFEAHVEGMERGHGKAGHVPDEWYRRRSSCSWRRTP